MKRPVTPPPVPRNTFPVAVLVNDVHSQLNPTRVARDTTIHSIADLATAVRHCAAEGRPLALAGGRNAMGGQAFLSGAQLLDTRPMNHVLGFDPAERWIEVEAGIQWPELVEVIQVLNRQAASAGHPPLGIIQKQTGSDHMTLGGSLSSNVHGRGLELAPLAGQVLALTLVNAAGTLLRCDRQRNSELFSLVLGGYGLFGAIASVKLQLCPRVQLQRRVVLTNTDYLMQSFDQRRSQGYTYGDFQFSVDPRSEDFLRKGVLSCYREVEIESIRHGVHHQLSAARWQELITLAHVDKARAFEQFSSYYLSTDGQIYGSDVHQLATYLVGYHGSIDDHLGHKGSEVISELNVPRQHFGEFMGRARELLRDSDADLIYGTVRLIERDQDSFLAWAREAWVCTVFNLHVRHEPWAIAAAGNHFRALYDIALDLSGNFYLTYHSWASPQQLLRGHPRLPQFLKAKRRHDPEDRFQSDWSRQVCDSVIQT